MRLPDPSNTWPPAGGEMAEAIRHTDWSQTPLGPRQHWPASLRIAVTTALDSPLPVIVLWGPELLQIYNDAYRPILGLRHPAALGQATRDCWREVWHFNQPIYQQVMASGQPVYLEDQAYVIESSGVPETRYFTVTYAPLRDEAGAVRGVTVIAVETTRRVVVERENQALLRAARFDVEQLRQMFEQAPNFIMALNGPDHVFEFVNAAATRLLAGRDVVGKSVPQALPELEAQGFVKQLDHVYQSGETFVASNQPASLAASGAPLKGSLGDPLVTKYVDLVYQPIKDAQGQAAGIFISGTDVTKQHQVRLALSDNLQRLQAAETRHAFQLTLADRLRPLTDPTEVTTAACELLGKHLGVSRVQFCDINDAQGTFFIDSDWTLDEQIKISGVTHKLNDFGLDHVAALRSGKVSANDDVTLDPRTADHAEAYAQLGIRADLAVPLVKSGALTVVLSLNKPVPHHWTEAEIDAAKETAERAWAAAQSARAQAELQADRNQNQDLFDIMVEGFALIDSNWCVTQINAQGLRIARRTKSEVLGKNHWQTWPEVIGTEQEALYRHVMAMRVPDKLEHEVHFGDGHRTWMDFSAYPLLDGGIAVFFRDVSERHEATEALRLSQVRAESALAVAQLGTFDFNIATNQVECSDRTRAIFGFTDDQGHIAQDFFDRILESDLPRVRQEVADATGQNRRLDTGYRIQLPDGSIRHIFSASACQPDASGSWVRHVGVLSDATARKQAEEKLLEVDRRKDEFLAMLAHELRNPLAPITMAAGILSRPGVNETILHEMSAIVVRQADHMTSLIDDLLDVSRINKGLVALGREALDLKDVVASAVEQVRPLMEKQSHDFSMQVTGEALRVEGDRVRLVQVFSNEIGRAHV